MSPQDYSQERVDNCFITAEQLLEIPEAWRDDLCARAINGSCAFPRISGILEDVCLHPESCQVSDFPKAMTEKIVSMYEQVLR